MLLPAAAANRTTRGRTHRLRHSLEAGRILPGINDLARLRHSYSCDIVLPVLTRLNGGRSLIPSRSRISSAKHPDRLWGPPNRWALGMRQPGRDAEKKLA